MATAREIHYRYLDLMRVNFITTSPAPVKAAMAEMGLITDALRMPMMPLDEANRARVREVLASLDLLPTAPRRRPRPGGERRFVTIVAGATLHAVRSASSAPTSSWPSGSWRITSRMVDFALSSMATNGSNVLGIGVS